MSLCLSRPSYRFEPIASVEALSRALGFQPSVLKSCARSASQKYRLVKPKPGSTRVTFDAIGLLKEVHRRLKERILSRVIFPDYLQGSIKGRDYVSNASLHTNAKILICEDVKSFFPSVSRAKVFDVWNNFFGFSVEVSELLADLTTKDGCLPQGAISSSYLANLALWRDEPLLQASFASRGLTYSRYVDDISVSSRTFLSREAQTEIIGKIYGMLRRNGLQAKRGKHEVYTAKNKMIVTKLLVNSKTSLSPKKRSKIRAQVHKVELALSNSVPSDDLRKMLDSAAQQVGQLGRHHSREASQLRMRLEVVKTQLPPVEVFPVTTYPANPLGPDSTNSFDLVDGLPWE